MRAKEEGQSSADGGQTRETGRRVRRECQVRTGEVTRKLVGNGPLQCEHRALR